MLFLNVGESEAFISLTQPCPGCRVRPGLRLKPILAPVMATPTPSGPALLPPLSGWGWKPWGGHGVAAGLGAPGGHALQRCPGCGHSGALPTVLPTEAPWSVLTSLSRFCQTPQHFWGSTEMRETPSPFPQPYSPKAKLLNKERGLALSGSHGSLGAGVWEMRSLPFTSAPPAFL